MEVGFSIKGVRQPSQITGVSVNENGTIHFDGPVNTLPEAATEQPQPITTMPARGRAASRPSVAPQPAA